MATIFQRVTTWGAAGVFSFSLGVTPLIEVKEAADSDKRPKVVCYADHGPHTAIASLASAFITPLVLA